jgi:hypothetical protein
MKSLKLNNLQYTKLWELLKYMYPNKRMHLNIGVISFKNNYIHWFEWIVLHLFPKLMEEADELTEDYIGLTLDEIFDDNEHIVDVLYDVYLNIQKLSNNEINN